MRSPANQSHPSWRIAAPGIAAIALAICSAANAQAPASAPPRAAANGPNAPEVHAISEDQLRRQLQGKMFYLRGGYFGDDLRFDERGRSTGSSHQVPYTLSMVQIDR